MSVSATAIAARYRNAGSAQTAGASKPTSSATSDEQRRRSPASTSGYRAEIGAAQSRQRPRSSSHESTGTLSRGRIA